MYTCSSCGKEMSNTRYPGGMCQGCYNYFRRGGIVHQIPMPGEIRKDADGLVICHICGRSFKRLGSHVKESHGMTIDSYKERYELCRSARTTEDEYSHTMHNYSYQYNMPQRLMETGEATRIKPGETAMRKGKAVRLQEILDKRNRKNKTEGDTAMKKII